LRVMKRPEKHGRLLKFAFTVHAAHKRFSELLVSLFR
jgi:hypothetical protein